MARKRSTGFTEREAEILSILWELGEASVEGIRKRLSGNPTASTVRTLLSVMSDRGFVTDNGEGYARLFYPGIDKKKGQRSALQQLIDTVFGGSREALLLRLMDDEEIDIERLKQMQDRLNH